MPKANKRQNTLVVFSSVIIISISAILTAYYTDQLPNLFQKEDDVYKNISLTDASSTCEDRSRDEFDSDLSLLVVDNHSSRFDNSRSLYKVFLKADVHSGKHETTLYYITCFVKGKNGKIAKFDVFENKEVPEGKVIRRGGEKLIEWPR